MIFSDAEQELLKSDRQQIGVFFRLATTPNPVRLWLGVGPCNPGITAEDPSGAVYMGFGEIADIPPLQQLLNGTAEGVDFVLSGVSPEILALIAVDAPAVKRKAVQVGIGIMDDSWQLVGGLHWMWRGIADFLAGEIKGAKSVNGTQTRSVKLAVGTTMTGRRRRGRSFWTDADHQEGHAGDRMFERTLKYSQAIQKSWPRF